MLTMRYNNTLGVVRQKVNDFNQNGMICILKQKRCSLRVVKSFVF